MYAVKSGHPVLECSACGRELSVKAAEDGMYDLSAMVCGYCYAAWQNMPYEVSCFGKPTMMQKPKKLGFDPEAEECQRHCPDRIACARVLGVRI